jgi:hypothetical protein
VRFDRDERVLLRPLPLRHYRSLVLTPTTPSLATPQSAALSVERRPLAWYDRVAGVAR